jgi:hypothetical protein
MYKYLLIASLCFLSCQQQDPLSTIPLSEEKLIEVLTDAYLAEAAILNYTPDLKDSLSDHFYQQVYKIHQVSEADYQLSLAIVKQYPEIMDSLYTKINARLLELEDGSSKVGTESNMD